MKVLSKDAVLTIYNSKNVDVKGLKFGDNEQPTVLVMGKGSENINFSKNDFSDLDMQLERRDEVSESVINLE